MSKENRTYLEEQVVAVINREDKTISMVFQREKINLDHPKEIEMLKELNPTIQKEIKFTEDELSLVFHIPTYYITFFQLKKKNELSRWVFASQLLKKIREHKMSRLHMMVCPDNILLDEGLSPIFLYYGVRESLPPYEREEERLWEETKAVIASAVDGKHLFVQYLKLRDTLELSPLAGKILGAENEAELLTIISENIKLLEEREKTLLPITKKKWKATRYTALGLCITLLPFLVYTLYALIFVQPKQAAFINSQEYFLNKQYSDVVDSLTDYDVETMPKIVQYQLAQSYIINESLTEEQRDNVENTITLQADSKYYKYWIYIGRGNPEAALEIARFLEDRDLIVYGLLQYREKVKGDEELESEEKQQKLQEIQSEIDEFEKEQKAKEEEERRLQEEQARQEEEELQQIEAAEAAEKEEAAKQKEEAKDKKKTDTKKTSDSDKN